MNLVETPSLWAVGFGTRCRAWEHSPAARRMKLWHTEE